MLELIPSKNNEFKLGDNGKSLIMHNELPVTGTELVIFHIN